MTLKPNLCRGKWFLQQQLNVPDSVKQAREKSKKSCNVDQKITMKILIHYPLIIPFKIISHSVLRVFTETFPTNMKPSECLAKDTNGEENKKKQEKNWKGV